jgi:hypothetical protein
MSLFLRHPRSETAAGIAVGYFDDWDAALRAIASEPQYKAAYYTLTRSICRQRSADGFSQRDQRWSPDSAWRLDA